MCSKGFSAVFIDGLATLRLRDNINDGFICILISTFAGLVVTYQTLWPIISINICFLVIRDQKQYFFVTCRGWFYSCSGLCMSLLPGNQISLKMQTNFGGSFHGYVNIEQHAC